MEIKSLKLTIENVGMTLLNVSKNLTHTSIICEAKGAVTSMGNSLRVAGTMKIAGND